MRKSRLVAVIRRTFARAPGLWQYRQLRLAARLDGVTADTDPDLTHQVVLLDPRQSKGLEFDSVLVVEPSRYGTSDLYVALTRATQRLGVLHTGSLPKPLAETLG